MAGADRRGLGRVFNEVPELYDRVRPTYPDELFVDLVAITGMDGGSSVLAGGLRYRRGDALAGRARVLGDCRRAWRGYGRSRSPMAMLSTAIVVSKPVFTDAERVALAGFLAGYSGLTREAYVLDPRQFAFWCEEHHVHLFGAKRADIECFGRDLEERGPASRDGCPEALHSRRLLPLRRRGGASRALTSGPCPPASP